MVEKEFERKQSKSLCVSFSDIFIDLNYKWCFREGKKGPKLNTIYHQRPLFSNSTTCIWNIHLNFRTCSSTDYLFSLPVWCDEGDDYLHCYPYLAPISINTSSETMNNSDPYFVKYSNTIKHGNIWNIRGSFWTSLKTLLKVWERPT